MCNQRDNVIETMLMVNKTEYKMLIFFILTYKSQLSYTVYVCTACSLNTDVKYNKLIQ